MQRPVLLIRHGESEYNAACKKGTGFGDPSDIFDAPLTANGIKQVGILFASARAPVCVAPLPAAVLASCYPVPGEDPQSHAF